MKFKIEILSIIISLCLMFCGGFIGISKNDSTLKYNPANKESAEGIIEAVTQAGGDAIWDGEQVIKNGKLIDSPALREYFTEDEIAVLLTKYGSSSLTSTGENKATVDQGSSTNETATNINNNEVGTKTETKEKSKTSIYTEEEIAAAWEETGRTESTCTENGSVEYTNSLTGEIKTEELELTEHDYQESERIEATCTEDGSITYTCSICGDSYTDTISATGHTEGNWVVIKEAGLFSEGLKQEICPVDNEVLNEGVIPQTCPLPLAGVIGIIVAIVIIGSVLIGLFINKKRKAM